MTGSTVINCGPREAGRTAQSSPIPKGARGDAEPSQRPISAISFSSPRAATDCDVYLVNGCTAGFVPNGEHAQTAVAPENSNRMVCKLNKPCATIAVVIFPVRS